MSHFTDIRQLSAEVDVRAALTEWFEQRGAAVYWGESVDRYTQETFSIESRGISSWGQEVHRPDMIIQTEDHVAVIEVKTGDSYGTIADGIYQTFEYWERHQEADLVYRANGETLDPECFLFATRYAPFGHIYPSDHEFYYSNGEMYGVNEQVPQYESNMSGVSIRALWRFAQNTEASSISAGVGGLFSDTLEAIPNFDAVTDDFDMVRVGKIEQQGNPAAFYWDGDQQWIQL